MSNIETLGNTSLGSTISDPFARNKIKSISVHYIVRTYHPYTPYSYGLVEFQNNNTKAEVRFDGDTFDEVAIKIKQFIENEL